MGKFILIGGPMHGYIGNRVEISSLDSDGAVEFIDPYSKFSNGISCSYLKYRYKKSGLIVSIHNRSTEIFTFDGKS